MVSAKFVVASSLAIQASATMTERDIELAQIDVAPNTPLYNCHSNCGHAILQFAQSEGDVVCWDHIFLDDYNACRQCSGPDNHNIWDIYSYSLTAAAGACDLPQTPMTGQQKDVPPAFENTFTKRHLRSRSVDGCAVDAANAAFNVEFPAAQSAAPQSAAPQSTVPPSAAPQPTVSAANTTMATPSPATSATATTLVKSASATTAGTAHSTTAQNTAQASPTPKVVTAGSSGRITASSLAALAALGAAFAIAF